ASTSPRARCCRARDVPCTYRLALDLLEGANPRGAARSSKRLHFVKPLRTPEKRCSGSTSSERARGPPAPRGVAGLRSVFHGSGTACSEAFLREGACSTVTPRIRTG